MTIPQNTPNPLIRRNREHSIFKIWMALPSILRGVEPEKLRQLGIDDENIIDVLQIKSMRQFAERFGLSDKTVRLWKKKTKLPELIMEETIKHFQALAPNVLMGLYKTAVRHGKSAEFEAFWRTVIERKGAGSGGGRDLVVLIPLKELDAVRNNNSDEKNSQADQAD